MNHNNVRNHDTNLKYKITATFKIIPVSTVVFTAMTRGYFVLYEEIDSFLLGYQ